MNLLLIWVTFLVADWGCGGRLVDDSRAFKC